MSKISGFLDCLSFRGTQIERDEIVRNIIQIIDEEKIGIQEDTEP
jgi:hypothetical protein